MEASIVGVREPGFSLKMNMKFISLMDTSALYPPATTYFLKNALFVLLPIEELE
jgi:hypothetical protein